MAHMMYSQHHAAMAPPQKPETFMLSSEAQQSLSSRSTTVSAAPDVAIASPCVEKELIADALIVKYFLISAPVDWTPDQYIRRFLLPTGEYVSCVLWFVFPA
jgi:transcription factor STE12